MKINYTGAVTVGCLGVIFIITLGYGAEGRALQRHPSETHVIHKRNAWWSKKSTDDAGRLAKAHLNALERESKTRSNLQTSIDCYTEECVPDFVLCGRESETNSEFLQCKLQHRMCAGRCFGGGAGI